MHCQVLETLPVTHIQVLEQLGCIYFQGHVGMYSQELQNSSGASPTGGSRQEPGDGARNRWQSLETIFQEVDFSMLGRIVWAPVPPDGTSAPPDFIHQVHHIWMLVRQIISYEVIWLYLPPMTKAPAVLWSQHFNEVWSHRALPALNISQAFLSQPFPSQMSSLNNVAI